MGQDQLTIRNYLSNFLQDPVRLNLWRPHWSLLSWACLSDLKWAVDAQLHTQQLTDGIFGDVEAFGKIRALLAQYCGPVNKHWPPMLKRCRDRLDKETLVDYADLELDGGKLAGGLCPFVA